MRMEYVDSHFFAEDKAPENNVKENIKFRIVLTHN